YPFRNYCKLVSLIGHPVAKFLRADCSQPRSQGFEICLASHGRAVKDCVAERVGRAIPMSADVVKNHRGSEVYIVASREPRICCSNLNPPTIPELAVWMRIHEMCYCVTQGPTCCSRRLGQRSSAFGLICDCIVPPLL